MSTGDYHQGRGMNMQWLSSGIYDLRASGNLDCIVRVIVSFFLRDLRELP